MDLEPLLFALMAALVSTSIAAGSFLQAEDALEDHREALPKEPELHLNPSTMAWTDFTSNLRWTFSRLDRDSPGQPTPETRALRSAQGWFFILMGAGLGAFFAWMTVLLRLADISPFMVTATGGLVLVSLFVIRARRLIIEYRQKPRSESAGIWKFSTSLPALVYASYLDPWRRDPENTGRINARIQDFRRQAASCGEWPWWIGLPSIRVEEGTTRVVVDLNPACPWHPQLRHMLGETLRDNGYRPVPTKHGGWATRFCDPVDLHRLLTNVDGEVTQVPG